MGRTVEEIMTRDPRTVNAGDPVIDAARIMRDDDIGDVIVVDDGTVEGIVTDRDIVVRGVAESGDPSRRRCARYAPPASKSLEPTATVDDALRKMREADIRRLPVVEDGRPVGIVTLGDLAVEREPDSILADISAASPDN